MEKFNPPHIAKFRGTKTTDIDKDITNAYNQSNFTLETTYGKITWLNGVNLVEQPLESSITIENNLINVDSSSLHNSFNSSAEVSIYGLTSLIDPKILINNSEGFVKCRHCQKISFNKDSGELVFRTPSFSAYTGVEGTNLSIFDEVDTEGGSNTRYANQQIKFFANYTNSTDQPIISEGSYCEYSTNATGTWNVPENMTYNTTSLYYEYNRSFANKGTYYFNISCYSATNANLTLIDDIALPNWIPTAPTLASPANGSTTTDRTKTLTWNNTIENDDSDNVIYELLVDDDVSFNSPYINVTVDETVTNTSYTPSNDSNIDTIYYWKVRAYDGEAYGNWSQTAQFEILSLISITLPVATIDFGALNASQAKNTTASGLNPIVISNDGNVYADVLVNATALFVRLNSSGLHQFMINENETSSYTSAITDWTNITTVQAKAITGLKYENNTNTANRANLHLLVKVPTDEPAGAKSSTVYIEGSA
jgi:hypothetical protein